MSLAAWLPAKVRWRARGFAPISLHETGESLQTRPLITQGLPFTACFFQVHEAYAKFRVLAHLHIPVFNPVLCCFI